MSDINMTVKNVLDGMDPEIVLQALRASTGVKTPESDAAIETVAKAFEKSGVDCGPKGCRSGFIQRQMMHYAGEHMIRELHQRIAQNESSK